MARGESMQAASVLVYVAGPHTVGDVMLNVRTAVLAGLEILSAGHVPFIPHLNLFAHYLVPHPYDIWLQADLQWLAACDCLVRLPGVSPGADVEVERARVLGMPVYLGLPAFLTEHRRRSEPIEQTIKQILEAS